MYLIRLSVFLGTLVMSSILIVEASDAPNFDFLKVANNSVDIYHGIKSRLKITDEFKFIGEHHYRAVFHEHPFDVNVAAFVNENALLAVHAESVTDDSGYLDYGYLDQVTFYGTPARYSQKCLQLTAEQVDQAHDLSFFKSHGFDFSPHIRLEQLFMISADRNNEIVITYATKHNSCNGTMDLGTSGFQNIITHFTIQ